MLQKAWASTATVADPAQKTNIVVLHAIGGAGKTALMRHFVDGLADTDFAGADKVFGWSAYSQGSGDNKTANADEVIARALGFFGHDLARHPIQDPVERGRKLAHLVAERPRSLLILDGRWSRCKSCPMSMAAASRIAGLPCSSRNWRRITRASSSSRRGRNCRNLRARIRRALCHARLSGLIRRRGSNCSPISACMASALGWKAAVEDVLGHALSLNLLGAYLDAVYGGDVNQRSVNSFVVMEEGGVRTAARALSSRWRGNCSDRARRIARLNLACKAQTPRSGWTKEHGDAGGECPRGQPRLDCARHHAHRKPQARASRRGAAASDAAE